MGRRASTERKAIEQSEQQAESEPQHQQKPSDEVGSNADRELQLFFTGAYAAELGLKSSAGGQLDRMAYRLGPSTGRVHDGWDNAVKFGVPGAAGRLEMGRVKRALEAIAGPPPEDGRLSARDEQERLRDWPHYFDALRGFYAVRPHGAFGGILTFGEYAGVVLGLPEVAAMASAYRARMLAAELAENDAALARALVEHDDRIGVLEGRLRVALAGQARDRHLRARQLRREIAQARKPASHPWTEQAIRAKWRQHLEDHALAALRELVARADDPRESPERNEARDHVDGLKRRAASLLQAAKTAYRRERRRVDQQIREDEKLRRKAQREGADGKGWAKSQLGEPEVPADQD